MDFDRPSDVFLADCPARFAVEMIADKWTVVVIHALSRGPRRHGELVDLIGGISRKVLTSKLRDLEHFGIVIRTDLRSVPRHVEYSLSELGTTLIPVIEMLSRWAEDNGAELVDAHDRT